MIRLTAVLLAAALPLLSQGVPDTWRKPFPPHRIAGNVYYVGTADLTSFLITTPEGHILINGGLADSAALIRRSISELGFELEDVKILLTNQAHFDHVAAFAELKKLSGARLLATAGDAPVLEDGGKSDFHFGRDRQFWFAPVEVDGVLKDGEVVRLGGTELKVHLTPGHTKGSVTYSMTVQADGRSYQVLIANMGSINAGVKLVSNPDYADIAEEYARTFRVQKSLPCDIFLAAHGSQYGLADKYKLRSFVDPQGYVRAVTAYEEAYRKQLAEEMRR